MADNSFFSSTALMGVCYSPFHQKEKPHEAYTREDVAADMALIAKNFSFIRTYTVQLANVFNVQEARSHGIQLALGVWIFPGDTLRTNAEIDTAISQAADATDTVKIIVIGNEVDLESANYTPEEVDRAVKYAKKKKAGFPALADVPLTVCFTGTGPTSPKWQGVLNQCERCVLLTIYPWWAPNTPDPDNIAANMKWSYDNGMKQAEAAGLEVIIGEIGWPSEGNPAKKTSIVNEFINYGATCKWIQGNNPPINKRYVTFWFEMFDEPWKTQEGPQGPYWGLYTSGKTPQPKQAIPACEATGT